jgi:hypothetical protein
VRDTFAAKGEPVAITAAELATELLPHQNRVILERLQLTEKVNKLEAFVLGETFSTIPEEEQTLLSEQLDCMAGYLRILDKRVAFITGAKQYTSSKEVLARPMTRLSYNVLRGWEVPANENPADEGYLIENLDGSPGNHPDFAGYISWSPKDMFERSHKEAT